MRRVLVCLLFLVLVLLFARYVPVLRVWAEWAIAGLLAMVLLLCGWAVVVVPAYAIRRWGPDVVRWLEGG